MSMRRGGVHHWAYRGHWRERKIRRGVWDFRFRTVKRQKPRPGVPKGSRYDWDIFARQYAIKTGPGRYKTVIVGRKKLRRAKVPKINR